ncbi:MAG TPA: nucleotide sugar dehydrogenase [Terriglobales bacterium]|nr:nucleotide sugar dehydrogenase [Terriglobales bacterium]
MLPFGVYGSGFLATVISAGLSDFGTPVFCSHDDADRLLGMAKGAIPFHEKNLEEVIRRNVRCGRLVYSSEIEKLAARSQIIFLAEDSAKGIEETALHVARLMPRDTIMAVVTPVPVGTAAAIEKRFKEAGLSVTVVSLPIFLTDGCAVEDFNCPDRIILGTESQAAVKALKQIFRPLVMRGVPVLVTNHETAELARQADTAFLATKLSFINELAALCEHVGADAVDLGLALGLDKRIGPRCLQAGSGIGGPFAETDMYSLSQLAGEHHVPLKVLAAARDVNSSFSDQMAKKICDTLENITDKQVAMIGLAFKPNTNSVAGSSSIRLIRSLIARGANVRAYDPVAMPGAKTELDGQIKYCDSVYSAVEGAHALVVGTGWPEFRNLDFQRIRGLLKRQVIVDTKNLLDGAKLRGMGFRYVGVGR